jgi:hypothetical protein
MTTTVSASTRRRGRGSTAAERKMSRAAFKAWDTRRANAAFEKRSAAATKAAATRRKRSK